jgi:hypothetical protein
MYAIERNALTLMRSSAASRLRRLSALRFDSPLEFQKAKRISGVKKCLIKGTAGGYAKSCVMRFVHHEIIDRSSSRTFRYTNTYQTAYSNS